MSVLAVELVTDCVILVNQASRGIEKSMFVSLARKAMLTFVDDYINVLISR
jgi:hypothetical protein